MRIRDWSSDVCSSDLSGRHEAATGSRPLADGGGGLHRLRLVDDGHEHRAGRAQIHALRLFALHVHIVLQHTGRSEEHTSELQSLMRISYAVFCLKKKIQNI